MHLYISKIVQLRQDNGRCLKITAVMTRVGIKKSIVKNVCL
jgi:hypothetical protein